MYKTAVITDEISQDLRVATALVREYGLNGLEIRSVGEKNPFQMSDAEYQAYLELRQTEVIDFVHKSLAV